MNELRQALLPGEEIIFETRKHWMAPIRASIIAILLVIGGLILWALAPPGGEGLFGRIGGVLGTLMWWIGLAILVIGAAWLVWNIAAWLSANFGVSNQRVLRYEGLLRKHSSETLLSSVTDVKLTVPALGGTFGYGDLTILTASGAEGSDRFTTIRRAAEFRTALQTAQASARTATAPAASPAAPSPAPQRQRRLRHRSQPSPFRPANLATPRRRSRPPRRQVTSPPASTRWPTCTHAASSPTPSSRPRRPSCSAASEQA